MSRRRRTHFRRGADDVAPRLGVRTRLLHVLCFAGGVAHTSSTKPSGELAAGLRGKATGGPPLSRLVGSGLAYPNPQERRALSPPVGVRDLQQLIAVAHERARGKPRCILEGKPHAQPKCAQRGSAAVRALRCTYGATLVPRPR